MPAVRSPGPSAMDITRSPSSRSSHSSAQITGGAGLTRGPACQWSVPLQGRSGVIGGSRRRAPCPHVCRSPPFRRRSASGVVSGVGRSPPRVARFSPSPLARSRPRPAHHDDRVPCRRDVPTIRNPARWPRHLRGPSWVTVQSPGQFGAAPPALLLLHPPTESRPSTPEVVGAASGCVSSAQAAHRRARASPPGSRRVDGT